MDWETMLVKAIESHPSLDFKKHLISEVASLYNQKKELEEEKQWLYGKLNKISDVIEKARNEVNSPTKNQ